MAKRDLLCSSNLRAVQAEVAQAMYGNLDFSSWLCDWAFVRGSTTVIDLACGHGAITNAVSQRAGFVLGVDINTGMLGYAQCQAAKYVSWNCPGRVKYYGYDLEGKAFSDICRTSWNGQFDLAMMHFALHFIEDPTRFLASVANVLVKGGKLVVSSYAPGDREEQHEMQKRACGVLTDVDSAEYNSLDVIEPTIKLGGFTPERKTVVENKLEFPTACEFMAYYLGTIPFQEIRKQVPDAEEKMFAEAVKVGGKTGSVTITKRIDVREYRKVG